MKKTILLLFIITSLTNAIFAQTGTVRGNIKEASGEILLGATIYIKEHNIGTISDFNGNYNLIGIPEGKHLISFSFIGYKTETREVEVVKNQTQTINLVMEPDVIMGKEIIVTAQARGQVSAIIEQLNAQGIKNVISTEKLQELPDISAADAIGRLPGITVQRDGGEGQKIIVRGFEPKYNTISINGLNAPSTDLNNRSTDMNMISTDIIAGVEVMKANTADKDADGLGGNVNMLLKQADMDMKLKANVETGYSNQIKAMSSYKAGLFFSNRFFDKKFGVLISAKTELYDRSSDQWENDFIVRGDPDIANGETFVKPWVDQTSLKAVEENRYRNNASLLLDYKTENSLIKTSTFYSGLKRSYFVKSKKYSLDENYIKFKQEEVERTNFILSNAIHVHIILEEQPWNGE